MNDPLNGDGLPKPLSDLQCSQGRGYVLTRSVANGYTVAIPRGGLLPQLAKQPSVGRDPWEAPVRQVSELASGSEPTLNVKVTGAAPHEQKSKQQEVGK